jgi:hypothetical protein
MNRRNFFRTVASVGVVSATAVPLIGKDQDVFCAILNDTNYKVNLTVEFTGPKIALPGFKWQPVVSVCCGYTDVRVTAQMPGCTTTRNVPFKDFGGPGAKIASCKVVRTSPGIIRISY